MHLVEERLHLRGAEHPGGRRPPGLRASGEFDADEAAAPRAFGVGGVRGSGSAARGPPSS
eukprot:4750106-Pyramimonas_sp.AAC.1